jgi:CheY-like chemotaxis protein
MKANLMSRSQKSSQDIWILIADDNQTNGMIFKAFVENLGHNGLVVEDGRSALAAWRRGSVDLILMDVRMPVMCGLTATQEIRRREAEDGAARTPIIGLSADNDDAVIDACLAEGMDDYVGKPCSIAMLAKTLRRWLPEDPRAISAA